MGMPQPRATLCWVGMVTDTDGFKIVPGTLDLASLCDEDK